MTDKDYAFYTENFEIYQFHYKTYGHGVWYNPKQESYDAAIERCKKELYEKVQKDNPHLIMFGEEKKTSYGSLTAIGNQYPTPQSIEEIPKSKKTQEERIIDDIGTVKDPKVLVDTYTILAKTYPKIKEAYDNRFKQLTA